MSQFARLAIAYTSLRMAVFALCAVLLSLAGLRGLVLVALALVVSGILSFPLARKQRARLTAAYEQRRAGRGR